MDNSYDDIINLPMPVSTKRHRMSRENRAAQFAPYAALKGHNLVIKEAGRLTDERIELDDYEKDEINRRIQIISERIDEKDEVSITFFVPDNKKSGGSYRTTNGTVKKINDCDPTIILDSGEKIPMDDVIFIDGEIFRLLFKE